MESSEEPWKSCIRKKTIKLTNRNRVDLEINWKIDYRTKIFGELKAAKRISAKRWHKILGKLRFVSIAIPGSAGTFSALQLALNRSKDGRIRITKSLRAHIDTLASLASSLSHRPTHLAEIVPQEPTLLGTTDAAKAGMGGGLLRQHRPGLPLAGAFSC